MKNENYARDLAQHLRVTEVLTPLGWAFHKRWHLDGTVDVLNLASSGASSTEIDERVTDLWHTENFVMLKHAGAQLRRYAQVHPDSQRIAFARANLIDEAFACHQAGHYMASLLLTYAQIDGLTRDVTGASFFSGSNNDLYLSDDSLAGIADNLQVVRRIFDETITESGFFGKLSRHAVAHGRDLASGTRINSTKALVLLGALVEYLRPRAEKLANRKLRDDEKLVRGAIGTDKEGRLIDDRHLQALAVFRGSANMILMNSFAMMGGSWTEWEHEIIESIKAPHLHRNRFTWGGASTRHAWWFYQVPAGHFLGSALRRQGNGFPVELQQWLWDQPKAPDGPPWEADGWVSEEDSTPNWRMADVADHPSP